VRNLASLPAAPTVPSSMFSVLMPWCSKFMSKDSGVYIVDIAYVISWVPQKPIGDTLIW
jgi:hypothetical protein